MTAYGNGIFVTVGRSGSNNILYSSDGKIWKNDATATTGEIVAVCWGTDKFVATFLKCPGGGAINCVMTSPDGKTWTQRTFGAGPTMTCPGGGCPESNGAKWNSVAYGGGHFVSLRYEFRTNQPSQIQTR